MIEVTEVVQSITVDETNYSIEIQLAGVQGANGEGVPTGGTTGQILQKDSATDYDTSWVDAPNSAIWGSITGTLSDQTDLQSALDEKLNTGLAVLKSDYTPAHSIMVQQSGTGSPTALSIGNNTLLGRLSGGGSAIDDLSTSDVRTLLSINNLNNTSDLNKPVSTATQTALDLRVPYTGATGDIDLGVTYKITNMINPTGDFDAATKNYVDYSIYSIPSDTSKWTIGGDATGQLYIQLGSTDSAQVAFIQNNDIFIDCELTNGTFNLYRATGNILAYDVVNGILYGSTGLASVSILEQKLYSTTEVPLLEFIDTVLINDGIGFRSIESSLRYLYYSSPNNNNVAFDWDNGIYYDVNGFALAELQAGLLRFAGSTSLQWTNSYVRTYGDHLIGAASGAPAAKLHQDSGTGTQTYHKFTAGTTTGTGSTDGFDVGITSAGVAEIKQRENLALNIYTNNTQRAQFSAVGVLDLTGTNQVRATAGSVSSPSYSFTTSANAGIYLPATNVLGFSTNSVERMRIDTAGKLTIYQGTTLRGAMASVYSQITSVGNVGVGEDNLHSFSVPSGGFAANGDSFEVKCSGTFAANANNKRVKLKFGAITLFDTTALAFNAGDWEISARIFRITTTTGKSIVTWTCNNATLTTTVDYQAWAFNFLTANTLVVTGEATADNDIVQELMQVFWIPVS